MTVTLLTEHRLEFLSLKGDCRGSSESTLVKIPHCWKSHATAQLSFSRSNGDLVPFMIAEVQFMRAAKTLSSLLA